MNVQGMPEWKLLANLSPGTVFSWRRGGRERYTCIKVGNDQAAVFDAEPRPGEKIEVLLRFDPTMVIPHPEAALVLSPHPDSWSEMRPDDDLSCIALREGKPLLRVYRKEHIGLGSTWLDLETLELVDNFAEAIFTSEWSIVIPDGDTVATIYESRRGAAGG